MRGFRLLVLAITTVGGVLVAPAVALAHKLSSEVKVGEKVKVVAYFEEDIPAEFAEVAVTDAKGAVVFTGKTDERGVVTFAKPGPGEYTVAVKCLGHATQVKFETSPATYRDEPSQKAVGLTIGVGLLVGISAVSWFVRRRRRG